MKPRIRIPAGRIHWVHIVVYVTQDGVWHACPPNDDRSYAVLVMPGREADYERLCASGLLYSKEHTGREHFLEDNRRATH